MHQCGRCKDIFRNLQLYMQHKASKICKIQNRGQAAPAKKQEMPKPAEKEIHHVQTMKPTNILEEAAKDTIYKQLEILVVDEEPEESHSTVDVQSISTQQNSSAITYVAVQNKQDQMKMNAPILAVNKENAASRKGQHFLFNYQLS